MGHIGRATPRLSSETDAETDYDALDSIKLLAITYDSMSDKDKAIRQYEHALSTEKDVNNKASLMNALSYLHMKVGGQSHIANDHLGKAISYLEKSLQIQKDSANVERKENTLQFETMILLGNALSLRHSLSEAIHWYHSALNSNPDKSAINPTNLRALYNKGVTLLRNRDIKGAVHAFEIILDEVDKNPTAPPSGTAAVLNAIGRIYFANKNFVGAVERFTQSLSLKNESLSPCQSSGTLCNIGTTYYRMNKYEEAEKSLKEALIVSQTLDETSSDLKDLKETIMCKLGYVLFKRKNYHDAHSLFSDAGSISCSVDDQFSLKCESYARACSLKLTDQYSRPPATITTDTFDKLDNRRTNARGGIITEGLSRFTKAMMSPLKEEKEWDEGCTHRLLSDMSSPCDNENISIITSNKKDGDVSENVAAEDMIPSRIHDRIAQKPKFDGRLIPIPDDHNAARYREAVYPWHVKMLTALGVKPSNFDLIACPLADRKILCNRALESLLKQTNDCQTKYALEFDRLLVEKVNSKFMAMHSLLDNELQTADACAMRNKNKA